MKIKLRVLAYNELPKGYGVAYKDHARMEAICYPWGLNLIVRWIREFYYYVAIPGISDLDVKLEQVYLDGYTQALKDRDSLK